MGQYVMTVHAEEEMVADDLAVFDVESAILNGRIVERKRDRHTQQAKYLVRGKALDDEMIGVVVKLSPTGKMVIITVYLD
jgi:hypothetical protein